MLRLPVTPDASARAPAQRDLDDPFERATRARVYASGAYQGRVLGGPLLAEATGAEVGAVRDALRIRDESAPFRCACHGDLAIELSVGADVLETIGFHHGTSLRLDRWAYDADLADGRALLAWLAHHGAPQPLMLFEQGAERERESRRVHEAWLATAPPPLLPFIASLEAFATPPPPRRAAALAALAEAMPDEADRVVALLAWLGARPGFGAEPRPAYESIPLELLKDVACAAVARGISSRALSAEAQSGAVRFLDRTGWTRAQRSALASIPLEVQASVVATARDVGNRGAAMRVQASLTPPGPAPHVWGTEVVMASGHGKVTRVALDGDAVFAIDGQTLVRVGVAGEQPHELWTFVGEVSSSLLARGGWVYFQVDDALVRIRADGGSSSRVAAVQGKAGSLAVVGDFIYWIEDRSPYDRLRETPFAFLRAACAGGSAEVVVAPRNGWVMGAVVDERHLYWSHSTDVRIFERVGLESGERRVLAQIPPDATSWSLSHGKHAVQSNQIFVAEGRNVLRLAKEDGAITAYGSAAGDPIGMASSERGVYVLVRQSGGYYAVGHIGDDGDWAPLVELDRGESPWGIAAGDACLFLGTTEALRRVRLR